MFKLNVILSDYSMDEIRAMLNTSYDRKEMTWVEKLWTGTKLSWHPNKTTFYLKKWSSGLFQQDAPVRIKGVMEPYGDKTKVSLSAAFLLGTEEFFEIGIPTYLILVIVAMSRYHMELSTALFAALLGTAIWFAMTFVMLTFFSFSRLADETRDEILLKLEFLLEQKKKK